MRHMGVCVAAETEAGRPSQAKDNAVCVCRGCVCVCGGEAVCGVLCGMCGRVRSVLRAGGGGVGVWCGCVVYRCHEGACAPHGCVRGGRDRGRETQPGKGQRSVCVSGVCVCVCVCVCVWTAVCVCGGVCMWCVGRDTGIVSHSQAKDSTVCARARVCVCVRAHAYVRGVGRVSVCVGGGGT